MALITCPECKREISDKAIVCIHCGYPIAEYNNENLEDNTDDSSDSIIINEKILPKKENIIIDNEPATKNNGDSINHEQSFSEKAKEKTYNNKKRSIVIGTIIGTLIVILIALVCFGNSSKTPEKEPSPLPQTGQEYFGSIPSYVGEEYSSNLTVENNSNNHYYIKLYNIDDGAVEHIFFVRANSSCDIRIVPASLRIKYAYGNTWYGYNELFGEETVYLEDEKVYDFYNYDWKIVFDATSDDGDRLNTKPISSEDF